MKDTLSQRWFTIQTSLFPWLSEELGELTNKQQELVTTLEMIRIEEFILSSSGYPGRRPEDRVAIARAFVAKTVYNMPTTRVLLDRLETDISLRRICGWERKVIFLRNGLSHVLLLNSLNHNCLNVFTKA